MLDPVLGLILLCFLVMIIVASLATRDETKQNQREGYRNWRGGWGPGRRQRWGPWWY